MSEDEKFMRRALELAVLGQGLVSPNPCVGCVIVVENRIIGEGWHQKHGGPHAEVHAIEAVANKNLLTKAVVYVTLEPCSHHGKTPPCADMLIQHQVSKVIISTIDTNPLVGGNGIRKLRAAGIEVVTGVLEGDGRELNKRFFKMMEKQRPYIVLKWARTADGFIARRDFGSKWISNEFSRRLVHKWRSEEDAVLVGTTTAGLDDPSLSVRSWSGRNPVRIVIDRSLKLSDRLHLFDNSQTTLIYNVLCNEVRQNNHFIQLQENDFMNGLIRDLFKRKIQSVLIEGGSYTLNCFIENGIWDEARIFTSSISFGEGIDSPVLRGKLMSKEFIGNDTLETFVPSK